MCRDPFRAHYEQLEGERETYRLGRVLKGDESAKLDSLRKPDATFANSRDSPGSTLLEIQIEQLTEVGGR